ncbi:hypothetical protein ACFPK1_16270 [Actinomycetospora rhizophila]|uniref:Uncharacterized protein n=1 Tax=Actinomycetospora rhizophila TaxID=1416876 RepID=A0ABV9ZFL0_9PSEU
MTRTMKAAILALAAAGAMLIPTAVASAAPIDCPGGQTAQRVGGNWDCVNGGGNTSNAENPKSPNAGKGDF